MKKFSCPKVMLAGLIFLIFCVSADAGSFESSAPALRPFFDKYWCLLEDFTFMTQDGIKITVPAGFVTDLASVPDGPNAIFEKVGRYAPAGIIHDYLYWAQPDFLGKTPKQKRAKADRIIEEALRAEGVGVTSRKTIKWAIKLFGGENAWEKNTRQRQKGKTRIIPEEYRKFPVGKRWKSADGVVGLQEELMQKKIGPE